MRLYHFIDTQWGLEDLGKKHLKIARINELNDPFEFMGIDLSDDKSRELMRGLKDYLNQKYGLLCFSKGWQNPLLWSHYADSHKGLCLGFDVLDDIPGVSEKPLLKVKYRNERLSSDEFFANLDEKKDDILKEMDKYCDQSASVEEYQAKKQEFLTEIALERIDVDPEADKKALDFILDKVMSTKFSHWEYEQEYRLFCPLPKAKKVSDLYYFDFMNDVILKEVIIGARSYVTIEVIKALVGDMVSCANVFKVREAYREFAMTRDDDS